MAEGGSNKKVANSLVALSSAAILAVYTAGYIRTRSAADQFAMQAAERRPAAPRQPAIAAPPAHERPAPAIGSAVAHVAAAPAASPPPAQPTPATAAASVLTAPPDEPSHAATVETPDASAIPALPQPLPSAPQPSAPPTEAVAVLAEAQPAEPTLVPATPTEAPYKDGTYFGWGTSRHGDIQAEVVIEGGHIASATIAQCRTRYSCSVIAALPPQVALRQNANVDYVSGATQSSDAFYYGVMEALSKAR